MRKLLKLEEVKRRSKENGFIFLDPEYKGYYFKHNFRCLKDNEIHKSTFGNISRGCGLKCCRKRTDKLNGINRRLSLKKVKEISLKNGFIFLDPEYRGNRYKHNFKCLIDGETHSAKFNHISKGGGLKCCRKRKVKQARSFTLKKIKKLTKKKGFIFLDPEYKGASYKHKFKCIKDNEIHYSSCASILKGHGLKCCGSRKLSGENNHSWNPNLTDEERKGGRIEKGLDKWTRLVKERDNYICQICGKENLDETNGDCHAHHIESYSENKELRCDLNNGVTLDADCHRLFHHLYGIKTNKKQFIKFKYKMKKQFKISDNNV